jgi:hypothetical protein
MQIWQASGHGKENDWFRGEVMKLSPPATLPTAFHSKLTRFRAPREVFRKNGFFADTQL